MQVSETDLIVSPRQHLEDLKVSPCEHLEDLIASPCQHLEDPVSRSSTLSHSLVDNESLITSLPSQSNPQPKTETKKKSKRDIFAKGRSISLASFRLPSRMFSGSPKRKSSREKRKEKEERFLVEQRQRVRGELEVVHVDQLINMSDLS